MVESLEGVVCCTLILDCKLWIGGECIVCSVGEKVDESDRPSLKEKGRLVVT